MLGAGLHGGRNADPQRDRVGVGRAALHHSPQRPRHRFLPARRARTVAEATGRGRFRARLRDWTRLSQRGRQSAPQPRVYDPRDLRRVLELRRHDDLHRGVDRRRGDGRPRDDRSRIPGTSVLLRGAVPRRTMAELASEGVGEDVSVHTPREKLASMLQDRGVEVHRAWGPAGVSPNCSKPRARRRCGTRSS